MINPLAKHHYEVKLEHYAYTVITSMHWMITYRIQGCKFDLLFPKVVAVRTKRVNYDLNGC
jgi:hypothetical protein